MRVMHHSVSHRHVVKKDLNFDGEFLQIEITQTVQHCGDSVEDSPLRSSGLIWVSYKFGWILNEQKHRRTICGMMVTLDLRASRLIALV